VCFRGSEVSLGYFLDGRPRGGVEVQLYSFFNIGARWGGWSTPRPGRFAPRKDPVAIILIVLINCINPHRDSTPGPSSP